MLKKIITFTLFFCLFSVQAESALSLYEKGRSAQNREDWYVATEYYLEALDENPAFGEAWFSLAECSYELDQYELSLSYCQTASVYLKNRVEISNLQGFALIALKRLDEAEDIFLTTLKEYPNNVDARFGLAQLELFYGKYSGAQKYFVDALQRDSSNKKALLSLALIANELGDTEKARYYISQVLRYHNDRADVQFFAGYLAAKENRLSQAENYIRTAIALDANFFDAYKLLADILFVDDRYDEAIDICDYIIELERNSPFAWYIKGLSNKNLDNTEEALSSWTTGLHYDAQDEIMRAAFERLIYERVPLEDERRSTWAEYHLEKATIERERFITNTAVYEYNRALQLDPLNVEARLSLADILLQDGYAQSYLMQLEFLQSQGLATQKIEDSIESYASLLTNSLGAKWGIDTFYLDKTRYSMDIYHFEEELSMHHQEVLSATTTMLSDVFNTTPSVEVESKQEPIATYAEAFRSSRQNQKDFFAIVDVIEGERDIRIKLDLFLSHTGVKLASWEVYGTGNDRFASSVQKIVQNVLQSLPQKGSVIDRRGSHVLIDLGRKDGLVVDQRFDVYKKDSLTLEDSVLSLDYTEDEKLGTITITDVCEDIAQGTFKKYGFYDLVNIGDEIIPVLEVIENHDIDGEAKSADEESKVKDSVKDNESISEIHIVTETTTIYDLIHNIK